MITRELYMITYELHITHDNSWTTYNLWQLMIIHGLHITYDNSWNIYNYMKLMVIVNYHELHITYPCDYVALERYDASVIPF
jgi:hypothetical protein